jgi:hypothetical protein
VVTAGDDGGSPLALQGMATAPVTHTTAEISCNKGTYYTHNTNYRNDESMINIINSIANYYHYIRSKATLLLLSFNNKMVTDM